MQHLYLRWLFLWMVIIATIVMIVDMVKGEEGHPPPDQALHEQFYNTWNRPTDRDSTGKRLTSCCSKIDCYPTTIKQEGRQWFAKHRESGTWVEVPSNVLEQNQPDTHESPDGQSHACISVHKYVFCATIGSGT